MNWIAAWASTLSRILNVLRSIWAMQRVVSISSFEAERFDRRGRNIGGRTGSPSALQPPERPSPVSGEVRFGAEGGFAAVRPDDPRTGMHHRADGGRVLVIPAFRFSALASTGQRRLGTPLAATGLKAFSCAVGWRRSTSRDRAAPARPPPSAAWPIGPPSRGRRCPRHDPVLLYWLFRQQKTT